jgi:cytochrome c oxidase assembly protein subunit 15
MTSFLKDGRSQSVAIWLVGVTVVVFTMVVVGGATRLTGSGLSITEWKPVSGILPPLSAADWAKDFHLYQATPQYRQVNAGMSLGEFKSIFWWEWFHRLLGRLAGLAFALPFFTLLALRQMPMRLIWRCAILLALGGLQGLVGWWMVQSGLEHRILVAPERLVTHLGLALILFCALIWTAMEAWSGQPRARAARSGAWPAASMVFFAAVFFQCLLGALVAGNQAGLIDNDWPLMNGYLIPPDYVNKAGIWATLAHSQAAVQFDHRVREEVDRRRRQGRRRRPPRHLHRHAPARQAPAGLHPEHRLRRPRRGDQRRQGEVHRPQAREEDLLLAHRPSGRHQGAHRRQDPGGRFPERILEKAVERMLPKESPLARKQLTHLQTSTIRAEHPHEAQNPEVIDFGRLNAKNVRSQ